MFLKKMKLGKVSWALQVGSGIGKGGPGRGPVSHPKGRAEQVE